MSDPSTSVFPSMYSPEMIQHIQQWGCPWIRTGAVVWRGQGNITEYLLVHEAKVKRNGVWQPGDGGWNLPCGRVGLTADQSRIESLYEAAEREVLEESGQEVKLGPLVHISQRTELDNFHLLLLFGAEIAVEHQFVPTEEVSEIGWFSYPEIMVMVGEGRLRSPDMVDSALSRMRNMTKMEYSCGLRPITRTPKQPKA